ncbi:cupin [Streptomyces solisilvae]|uniref:cupin n=1 Tax=Streptomyces malaysiensis TaxID=92644 RepID=UPI0033312DC9
MTLLQVLPATGEAKPLLTTQDPDRIAAELGAHGARFERWALKDLAAGFGDDDVLGLYRTEADRFSAETGLGHVEVVRMAPDDSDPRWATEARASRDRYFNEHTHRSDEVWFFAQGRCGFYLRLADDETVHVLISDPGDLVCTPAGVRHWFDMGETPDFAALHIYVAETDWDEAFTGDPIASRFPHMEELLATAR